MGDDRAAGSRRLLVMRHAKAEAVAISDHARRLTDRGRRDAAEAGRWARSAGLLPDHVLVSDAVRALETWSEFRDGAALALEAEQVPGLYPAGTDAALEILRTAPAETSILMVVGHNPTMAHLVHLLDDGHAEPAAFRVVGGDFPTSALAVLEVDGDWAGLDIGGARIADVHVARS